MLAWPVALCVLATVALLTGQLLAASAALAVALLAALAAAALEDRAQR